MSMEAYDEIQMRLSLYDFIETGRKDVLAGHVVSALEEEPFVYPLVRDDLLAFCGYRWAKASSYMVFFTVDEGAATVDIHRIAHESRNWMQLLR